MSKVVLGINSAHADSSAVVVTERGLVAAIAEERLNRKKHCAGFPRLAVAEVLRMAGVTISEVTDIAVARDPKANLAAKATFVARNPFNHFPKALDRLRVHREVRGTAGIIAESLGVSESQVRAKFHAVEHHLAHIASAYYCSPLERAAGISLDGAGDFASGMIAACRGNDIRVLQRTLWPHSVGIYYTAVCQLIGFDRFGEEYKVMGLSAYGVPRYVKQMRELVRYVPGEGFRLNLDYFEHHKLQNAIEMSDSDEIKIPRLFSPSMEKLFGPAKKREAAIGDRERDIACSMQIHFENVYLDYVADALKLTGEKHVAMAGGCVLNSVANGRMLTEGWVDRAYFHPAASDDGTAAGAALHVFHESTSKRTPPLVSAYLGTEWSDDEIAKALDQSGMPYRKLDRDGLLETAANALSNGKIMGWFQGREEWGPRALGNRSILCHPGWPDMKAILNARIKNREPFRPFAPVIREERLGECFRGSHEVPFMICVFKVRPEWRDRLSAITHEDGTGRVQTVRREQNALYYDLLGVFEKKTGVPVLLNTSFNENEPIVHTPAQAIDCFARTRMDCLGIGSFFLEKPVG